MLAFGTRATADAQRRQLDSNGLIFYKSEWMLTGTDLALSPTIFLIEQPANGAAPAHYHGQNQFQVFVEGTGRIGREEIAAVTIHYAGAYTGYGPLIAGPQGMKYFTIRTVYETGLLPLPEARAQQAPGPKRHATSRPIGSLTPEELARLPQSERIEAIAYAADGLGAEVLREPPGQRLTLNWPAAADCVFLMVVGGSLVREQGDEITRWESIYASTPQELPVLHAGAGGAEVLAMFAPPRDPAYHGLVWQSVNPWVRQSLPVA